MQNDRGIHYDGWKHNAIIPSPETEQSPEQHSAPVTVDETVLQRAMPLEGVVEVTPVEK